MYHVYSFHAVPIAICARYLARVSLWLLLTTFRLQITSLNDVRVKVAAFSYSFHRRTLSSIIFGHHAAHADLSISSTHIWFNHTCNVVHTFFFYIQYIPTWCSIAFDYSDNDYLSSRKRFRDIIPNSILFVSILFKNIPESGSAAAAIYRHKM